MPNSPTTWTVVDTARGEYVEQEKRTFVTDDGKPISVEKQRLHGGLQDGVDILIVDNGALKFTVLLTRGMSIWQVQHGDVDYRWQSPVSGPVHPSWVPIWEPSGIGWLNGFDEMLVRCGLESNGAPDFAEDGTLTYPLHGKIGNLPAHRVQLSFDSATGELAIHGQVAERRLFCNKLILDATIHVLPEHSSLTIDDAISNPAGTPSELQLLYHANFGAPLLEPGSQVFVPAERVVPRNELAASEIDRWDQYEEPVADLPERVYFVQPAVDGDNRTGALLQNAAGSRGVQVQFQRDQLPYFILWKNTMLPQDGFVTGLEPAINLPNPRSFEAKHGRVHQLAPDETFVASIQFDFLSSESEVEAARTALMARQDKPEVSRQPTDDWCA